jgi:hypothetical protein
MRVRRHRGARRRQVPGASRERKDVDSEEGYRGQGRSCVKVRNASASWVAPSRGTFCARDRNENLTSSTSQEQYHLPVK